MKEDDYIVLKKVFYVPQFKTKIISVKKLTKNGYDVTFSKNFCKVTMPRQGGQCQGREEPSQSSMMLQGSIICRPILLNTN